MAQAIAYRLTIYDGTLFSTTTTVLTPVAGAIHSDPFQVATIQGVSGFQPFLRIPQGERGAFNLKNATSTVGSYQVTLLDKRGDEGNLNRWVSAFIGNSTGTLSIVGRKAYIEESLDGGATWAPFFVGKITTVDLSSLVEISFTIADSLELLKQEVFTSVPRVDYATFKSVWPLGFLRDVVTTDGGVRITAAKPFAIAPNGIIGTGNNPENFRILTLSTAAINRNENRWGYGSRFQLGPNSTGFQTGRNTEPFRALVKKSDGTELHYRVSLISSPTAFRRTDSAERVSQVWLYELSNGSNGTVRDGNYTPISDLDTGTLSSIAIYSYTAQDKKVSAFFLNKEPYTIIKDICEGAFFPSSSLSTTIPYVSSSLVSLRATQTLPDTLYRIKDAQEAASFLEKYICKPFGLGYTFEPSSSAGVPQSYVRFFSTALPPAASLPSLVTLNGSDVLAGTQPEWTSTEPMLAVQGTFYIETRRNPETATKTDSDWEPTAESSYTVLEGLEKNVIDASYGTDTLDFLGIRGVDATITTTGQIPTIQSVPAYQYVLGKARQLAQAHFQRHRHGNPTVRLSTIRNTKTNGIRVGDFVLVEVSSLPNQATHTRGGTRIMQVTQKTPSGIANVFELVDSGINAVMATPTLNTVSSPSLNVITFSVTTSEAAQLEIQYAVTVTGGSVPNAASAAWITERVQSVTNTTTTFTLNGIPNGRRVYVRVRAYPPTTSGQELPSPWVTSSGLDLSSISAATSVAVSNITSRSADVTWTNTNSLHPLEVWLASPAGTPDTFIAQLPPTSTRFRLVGLHLNSSTSHRVGIRYVDSQGGFSTFATADFTATGTASTLDAPAALLIYTG